MRMAQTLMVNRFTRHRTILTTTPTTMTRCTWELLCSSALATTIGVAEADGVVTEAAVATGAVVVAVVTAVGAAVEVVTAGVTVSFVGFPS